MQQTCLPLLILLGSWSFLYAQTSPGKPAITAVSNGASGAPAIQSGSWVSIYGANLSTATRSWRAADFVGTTLPTTLDDVSVLINGKKAAIYYISPGQLNVQAPAETATGLVPVQVANSLGTATGTATLAAYAPGIFPVGGKYAAARHADGVLVAPAGFFGASLASRPAVPGESLQVYATGLGPTTPAVAPGQTVSRPAPLSSPGQLSVTVGGRAATVQYAGLVAVGQYQINLLVPPLNDGDQSIVASIGGASSQPGLNLPVKNTVSGTITISLAPASSTVRCGASLTIAARVNNTSNQLVTWQVNGITGGNATVGTISDAGVYTAPAVLPAAPSVTITAVSQQDSKTAANASITLQNPLPVISSVTPSPVNPGNATLTLSGSGFAKGAVVSLAGTALTTTFVSDTTLTAIAAVTMPAGRLAAVKVTNPNPGTVTSAPVALPVRPAAEKMSYADAVRFLDRTTFGGSPSDVAALQGMGRDAWLAAQFAQPASLWPLPNTPTEGVARLQNAFFEVALKGNDQLRQRVALALAQILVVSAVRNTQFQQMSPYLKLLADSAFGSFRDLMTGVTLHPSMGYFLDMVNNAKANPTTGSVANENYARELMQLFSIGLVQLNGDGTPVVSGGSTLPEYTQADVAELAKVMTGWTYGQTPGFASNWNNPAYYFGPMIAFPEHHDTTAKTLNLPVPCTIPAGGTPESDLTATLDCIFNQPNTAPFVSYELIQRLVMSSPSPAYVGRVAAVFQSSKGNLQTVVRAILSDPEAAAPAAGKLAEPVLFATGLLRALGANVVSSESLPGQTNAMGQNILAAPSVFNYFSPAYAIPGTAPPVVAPEFQLMNTSTTLARANFAWRAVTNGISGNIRVDLSNLTDLAANPDDLVEAVSQALFAGQIDAGVRDVLTAAANASTSPASRVRSVFYAAAASPHYQVKQ